LGGAETGKYLPEEIFKSSNCSLHSRPVFRKSFFFLGVWNHILAMSGNESHTLFAKESWGVAEPYRRPITVPVQPASTSLAQETPYRFPVLKEISQTFVMHSGQGSI
jgi:hypothetical protein